MIDTRLKKAAKFNTTEQKTLKEITEPVSADLDSFRSFYKRALKTDVFLLDQMVRYLLRLKGKQIRPTIVFLSSRLFGDVTERSYTAATMIELLHTATLIHDDVVDEANKRRGYLSFNKLWKNKASVLMGDFLLSRGLLISIDQNEFGLLKVVSKAVKSMSEAELRQMKAAQLFNMTQERYFKVIKGKTASLFSACCECGAIATTDDEEIHTAMSQIGRDLGVAFQIRDDLFDYGSDDVGKPRRNDIKERKITLPLIKAIENTGLRQSYKIRKIMRKRDKTDQEIQQIVDFVRDNNGIRESRQQMMKYANRAIQQLENLPVVDEQRRRDLTELIEFIITRKK